MLGEKDLGAALSDEVVDFLNGESLACGVGGLYLACTLDVEAKFQTFWLDVVGATLERQGLLHSLENPIGYFVLGQTGIHPREIPGVRGVVGVVGGYAFELAGDLVNRCNDPVTFDTLFLLEYVVFCLQSTHD